MSYTKDNIILIGMPGCGKSTVGVVLAKVLGYRFIDTDLLIQSREDRVLAQIIADEGRERFLALEEEVILGIEAERTVIATGGSAICGERAMARLHRLGHVIYLRLPLDEIRARLGDYSKRGVSFRENQTLEELYNERMPLYEAQADRIIDAEGKDIRDLIAEITEALQP